MFFEILMYFAIYSFLGWIMESIFRSIIEKKIINTGFLKGPFCPIYGIGACIMILFLSKLKGNVILLFIVSLITMTIWEYLVGLLLEKMFKTKYWDYSDHKFNIQGRVCLTNSIFWGVLGVGFVYYIHPFIVEITGKVDINLLYYIISIVTVVFLVDFITSIIKVKNINGTLEHIEQLSKEIKEKLKELKEMPKENEGVAKVQKMVENLNRKRRKTLIHLYRNVRRLKKAFPAIDTKEIREILNKKIEIKKKNTKEDEDI